MASGVRRMEATTGRLSLESMEKSHGVLSKAAQFFKAAPSELLERLEQQAGEMKQLRQALEKFKSEASLGEAKQFLAAAKTVKGLHVLTATREGLDANALRKMGDFLRDKDPAVVGVLASISGEKITFLTVCGREAVAKGVKAGDLVKMVSGICGGKGGGKPDSTMGGGSDAATACELIDRITDMFADVRLESSIEGVEPRSVQSAYNMLVNGLREGTESGAISENTERLFASLKENTSSTRMGANRIANTMPL